MSTDWTAADARRDAAAQTAEWNAEWQDEARTAALDQLPPEPPLDMPTKAELADEERERDRLARARRRR